jgi:hypothetical protein
MDRKLSLMEFKDMLKCIHTHIYAGIQVYIYIVM